MRHQSQRPRLCRTAAPITMRGLEVGRLLIPERLLGPRPRPLVRPHPPRLRRAPAKPVFPAPGPETMAVSVPSAVTTATVLARMEPRVPAHAPRMGLRFHCRQRQGRMGFHYQVRAAVTQACVVLRATTAIVPRLLVWWSDRPSSCSQILRCKIIATGIFIDYLDSFYLGTD
jgi:hypothetical protein